MGLLSTAVTLIAIGTVGPLVIMLIFAVLLLSQGPYALVAGRAAGLVGLLGLLGGLLGLLAFVGQVLCFFSPLSQDTKTKLGICMVCGILSFIPVLGMVLGFVSLIAYLFFLYGLCNDLQAPHLTSKFNSAAFLGLLAILLWFGSIFGAMLVGPLALVFMVGGFVLGVFSFARYVQTILSLAAQAQKLKAQSMEAGDATGFTPFDATSGPRQD